MDKIDKRDKIDIGPKLLEELKAYGKKHYPEECCGLLTGAATDDSFGDMISIPIEFHPIDNVSKEPLKWDYIMDPNQYMAVLKNTVIFNKKILNDLAATFHTHPNGQPIPSQFDITGAAWHTVYLIYGVSIDTLAAWLWNGETFKKIPINNERTEQHIIYNDGKKRDWESWKNVGSL